MALRLSVVLLAVVAVGLLAIPAVTAAEYDLSTDDGVSVPEQTVEIDEFNDEFEIDTFVVTDAGNTVTVDATAPENQFWTVEVLNTDGDVETSAGGEGTESVDIDTTGIEPGTYALALEASASYEAVIPLVINGYDISPSYETSIDADEDLEVTAEVTETDATSPPDDVEFVAWDGDDVTRVSLDNTGGTTYERSVSLDEGEYDVYVATASGDEIEGFPAASGIQAGDPISVGAASDDDESDDDSDDSDSDDSDSDNGGGGGGGDTPPDLQSTWQTDVEPVDVETGDTVTITLGLRNAGGAAASETITVSANGESITDTDIRLTSDSDTLVELEYVFAEPGEYDLTAESETLGTVSIDTVTVTGEPLADDDPELEDATETPSTGTSDGTGDSVDEDTIPGFGIMVAIISVISLLSIKYRSQS